MQSSSITMKKMERHRKKCHVGVRLEIKLVDSILEKSELTEKDAADIGKLIKKSIREQHEVE